MKEKISVILGIYNHAHLLPKVLKAWETQTFQDFTVYICDDGSNDDPKAVLETHKGDLRWKYYHQVNKGMRLAKSLNNGLREAHGEYALFVMGDSVPRSDYLESFVKYLDKNRVLCGVRETISEDGDHISWDWRYKSRQKQLGWRYVPIQAYQWSRITGNGLLVPMWAVKRVGGWPEDFVGYGCDDNYLAVQLFAEGLDFADVPGAVLRHIEHSAQPDNEESKKIFVRESEKIFEHLKEKLRPQIVCLNFDDFSPINSNLFFLRKLRENYPGLKVSLFITPSLEWQGQSMNLAQKQDFCDELRGELDWLELLPHGWHHPNVSEGFKAEFGEMSYFDASQYLKMVDELFEIVKLPYKKIFKPPQYEISEQAKNCFRDNGWTLCVDGTGEYWPDDIKTISYNWNIRNHFPLRKTVISYGHIQNIGNGMLECWENLLQMPLDAEFRFLSEL